MDKEVTNGNVRGTYPKDRQDEETLRDKKIAFIYRAVYARNSSGRYREIVNIGR